ncbi:O-fucosyltransferase 20 isoform X1 [Dendrobium catenatum]|uniref:O-fucosyltransferase 20 isoform X1 n=1 Tax=Dendrobium catenatum TaxID=906689 RepID=UPI0009F18737|nr:O-fucosyltransferase 20 isoform X1 [Dendrobium catenatum]
MERSKAKQLSFITVPSQIIHPLTSSSFQGLLLLPKKSSRQQPLCWLLSAARNPRTSILAFLFIFSLFGLIAIGLRLDHLLHFSPLPCATSGQDGSSKPSYLEKAEAVKITIEQQGEEFWKQPEGMGYQPCLHFSREYRRASEDIRRDHRRKYLMVVVSGGMNQQRNQIVDAVVIARILGASLVVPILQVNVIWGDESEFSDIFDLDHLKKALADDVRVVSSLPSTHLMTRPVEEKRTPLHVSPQWIRSRYLRRLNREGVLLLRGLDSRLSKDLPPDLQKLRCKVAFQALRFATPIVELGNRLAERMRSKGPYLALHLRMEKDVWVRTGCLPGLSYEYDDIIHEERKLRPELLTARSNMTNEERKLTGLCPLNALEVTRLLKALDAPRNTMIYWAGGEPLGGMAVLEPLKKEFPFLYNKENLSLPGELEPFIQKASLLAAIDYIVCEKSNVFMPSHGGNMGHMIQGHRAFAGHKKFITPNKRHMLPFFLNKSLPETEFNRIVKELHQGSLGQPEFRTDKIGKDVTAYPVPECMCNSTSTRIKTVKSFKG